MPTPRGYKPDQNADASRDQAWAAKSDSGQRIMSLPLKQKRRKMWDDVANLHIELDPDGLVSMRWGQWRRSVKESDVLGRFAERKLAISHNSHASSQKMQ